VTLGAEGARDAATAGVARPVVRAADLELPSAIPAFLEACAKLAAEAAGRGDLPRARILIALAGCITATASKD